MSSYQKPMDVTSMLNLAASKNNPNQTTVPLGDPAVVDDGNISSSFFLPPSPPDNGLSSRRTSDSQTSKRRTPWNAGGYCLPLNLDANNKTPMTPNSNPAVYIESPADTSESATSSYDIPSEGSHSRASSLGSVVFDMAHSSSVTPITSMHPRRPSVINEMDVPSGTATSAPLSQSPKHKFSDSHSSLSSYASSTFQSGCHSRISSVSTMGSGPSLTSMMHEMPSFETKLAEHAFEDSSKPPRRPQSPSDAILITRGAGSNRSSPTEEVSPQNIPNASRNLGFLAVPTDQTQGRSHKRTVSAPNFAPFPVTPRFNPFPTLPETSAFTGHPNGLSTMPEQAESGASGAAGGSQSDIKCMYIENCDTGSQPRKAISHIFGRNKLCTRMIPAPVWVHYCRKHYQRSRYRNGHEYAKLQINLVEQQIERVQAWSEDNKQSNKPGVVASWSLAIRKREQKRLEGKQVARKRSYQEGEPESEDEAYNEAVMNGTAVPDWLLQRCGSGYSTEVIMGIVRQLKAEIHGNQISQIPDIEILPSINTEGGESKPKAQLKRKTSGNAASHKRSQSMGTALRRDAPPMMPLPNQALNHWDPDNFEASIEKRARFGPSSDRDNGYFSGYQRAPDSSMRRMQVAHRPAFSNIRENGTEQDSYFTQPRQGMDPFVFSGTQQYPGQVVTSQPEPQNPMPNFQMARPPFHQRAHSEVDSFYFPSGYRSGMASDYQPATYAGQGPSPAYETYAQAYPRQQEINYCAPPETPSSQVHSAGLYEHGSAPNPMGHESAQQYDHAGPLSYQPSPYTGGLGGGRMPAKSSHNRHRSSPNVARNMHRYSHSSYGQPAVGYWPRYEQDYERSLPEHAQAPHP